MNSENTALENGKQIAPFSWYKVRKVVGITQYAQESLILIVVPKQRKQLKLISTTYGRNGSN